MPDEEIFDFTDSRFLHPPADNIRNFPEVVSQDNQFELELMTALEGKIMVLSNDNGTFMVRSVAQNQSFGLVLKLASSLDRPLLAYGLLAALREYPFSNDLILKLKTYLEAKVIGHKEFGLEVMFN